MTTTDTRPTITCPSWCNERPDHLHHDESVLHGRVVLERELPELSESEGGRAAGSYIAVRISLYVDLPSGATADPVVFVDVDSRDFGGAVHLTVGETEQVGQALADAARLIHRDLDR